MQIAIHTFPQFFHFLAIFKSLSYLNKSLLLLNTKIGLIFQDYLIVLQFHMICFALSNYTFCVDLDRNHTIIAEKTTIIRIFFQYGFETDYYPVD